MQENIQNKSRDTASLNKSRDTASLNKSRDTASLNFYSDDEDYLYYVLHSSSLFSFKNVFIFI